MAHHTIARLYDDYDMATSVVRDLEAAGVPSGAITLVANAELGNRAVTPAGAGPTGSAGGAGAAVGTLLGGGAGLLAGIGSLAIPGFGPVVAAGWLVATLAGAGVGAAGGGLIGALAGAGVSSDQATVYAEGVRRGGTLVSARVEEAEVPRVEAVFDRYGSDDWQQRRAAQALNEASMPLGGPP
ncbi:MAG TPA: hypothetical protein VHB27_03355 [Rhodopila sp.]|uniref:hypothetical protein n=1 Tax=Rhodopila sp. TaxID=2480087 RepID=UPI002C9B6C8E|nr:hypothetical protein [Rhodopila sp.]HVY14239.1 hypothetical protein [Rhodopila sp.]